MKLGEVGKRGKGQNAAESAFLRETQQFLAVGERLHAEAVCSQLETLRVGWVPQAH